jgi:hypothetical protein
MTISDSQKQMFQEWMNSKGVHPQCPACGKTDWQAGDIISAPVMSGGGVSIGGPSIPMVQLI